MLLLSLKVGIFHWYIYMYIMNTDNLQRAKAIGSRTISDENILNFKYDFLECITLNTLEELY